MKRMFLVSLLILSLGMLLAACGDTPTSNPGGDTAPASSGTPSTASISNSSGTASTAGTAATKSATTPDTASSSANATVKQMVLSRDDAAKDVTTSFSPKDNSFYCIVELDKPVSNVTFKFVWTAVDAGGEQNYKILEKTVDAKADEKYYTGTVKLNKDWPTGKYRVDFYANDTLDKSLSFNVQ